MCTAAKNYFCGNFFGNFKDKHLTPPSSDDEEETGNDADSEAEKYMPKDHKKALKGMFSSKLGLVRKLKVPDSRLLAMGWGPFIDWVHIEVKSGKDTMVQRFQTIVASREYISEHMLSNLSSDNRSEQLHTLELTHCKLKKSFPNIGNLHNLRICKLSHNEIIVIKKASFNEMGMNVEWLVCDHNKLEALDPRAISSEFLPQLKVLNFAHNKLSFLPQDFSSGLENLRYLDLSYNKLQQLPDALANCRSLQLCFLQSNELSKLPAGIGRLTNLRKLFVSYNNLLSLPEHIGKCSALEKLHVNSNKISLMPYSIIDLWQKRGGSIEEFLVDGNPLVQPGLHAFEKGQLDIGFELFKEWLDEDVAEKEREQKELIRRERRMATEANKGEEMDNMVRKTVATLENTAALLKQSVSNVSKLEQAYLSEGQEGTVNAQLSLTKIIDEGDDIDKDHADIRYDREGTGWQMTDQTMIEDRTGNGDETFYFQHLKDGITIDSIKMADLRSLESSMLLLKKVKYIEARKALAKTKKAECEALKKEMPRHLSKFLPEPGQTELMAADFHGHIPVTPFDLHFCILVYVTKPMEPNCASLFEKFTSAADVMKRSDWEELCMHVKVKIPKEIQQEMWEFISLGKDLVKLTDFVAAWHIHDVEVKDAWIRRAARVLKLNYYSMDVGELRARLKAKSAHEAEVMAGEGSNSESSFSSNGGEGKAANGGSSSSSSSEDSDNSVEEERRRKQIVQVPMVEGERRCLPPPKAAQDRGASGGRGEARPGAKQPSQPSGRSGAGASTASDVRNDLGIPAGMVSLTEEQQFALSRAYGNEDSDQESVSSGETFPSEVLSINTDSSVSSFDARSTLGHLESDEEAARAAKLQTSRERMEVKSDLDILRLMELSPQEVLAKPQKKLKEEEDSAKQKSDIVKKKVRELRSKNTQKDARFRTDVFTVRLALREARRNMTSDNFATLVNFLIRSLKHIEHATLGIMFCWHVDNPSFRHATGVESINPYVRQLLEQMGFVCLRERYWVWPEKHLNMGDSGCWGRREVKSTCAGRDPSRIVDMVELFTRCQRNLRRARLGTRRLPGASRGKSSPR